MQTELTMLRRALGDELEEDILRRIQATAVRTRYPAGAVILNEGERGKAFHILLGGEVSVSQRNATDGRERLIAELGPGRFFGELSLLDSAPHMATVRAASDVLSLVLNESDFNDLLRRHPEAAYGILRQVVRTMRRQDQLAIADLQEKNVALQEAYAELQAAQAELIEKQRMEHEMALAADVQRSLLPATLPSIGAYDFAAYQQPARQVGGDMYDVVPLGDGYAALLLADVADKGMHAALIMAVTRTLFRVSAHTTHSPAVVLQAVHKGLLDVAPQSDTFVTAFYGVLHAPTGVLTYARAAQERPYLARPGQPVVALPGDGRFLGMLTDLVLVEEQVTLKRGDRLLIFSDGVPDALNGAGETYGYERLQDVLGRLSALAADELVTAVVDDVSGWTAGAGAFDDLTLLVLAAG